MNKSILYVALLCSSCVELDDESLGEATQHGMSLNGLSLNGISLNGISLNGISLNGISLNGISLNGISLNGTSLAAGSTSGPPLSGASPTGSSWTATAANGAAVKLRIDRAVQGTAANADVWFYAVSYQTTSGWSPLCGVDAASQPILAVPVAGVWSATERDSASYGPSATQFTLACRGTSVAKCVELGYKTYRGHTSQLASCVRLLRGDFCGTGTAYTVSGTTVNLYDNVGVQADTEAWLPEAEWTPAGARCINRHNAARFDLVVSRDPKCVKPLETTTCGSGFSQGAVLIGELPSSVGAPQSQAQAHRRR